MRASMLTISGHLCVRCGALAPGYGINMFCMSLMKDEIARPSSERAEYLKESFRRSKRRSSSADNRMLGLAGNIYFTAKLGAPLATRFSIAALMTGSTQRPTPR
jgi:hypothetical protein